MKKILLIMTTAIAILIILSGCSKEFNEYISLTDTLSDYQSGKLQTLYHNFISAARVEFPKGSYSFNKIDNDNYYRTGDTANDSNYKSVYEMKRAKEISLVDSGKTIKTYRAQYFVSSYPALSYGQQGNGSWQLESLKKSKDNQFILIRYRFVQTEEQKKLSAEKDAAKASKDASDADNESATIIMLLQ